MTERISMTKRLISALLAVLMLVTLVPMTVLSAADGAANAILTVADPDTSKTYEDDNFLGHEYSTEFAGRIWTDKSVNTIAGSRDFLVKFSALATSKSVTGQTNAPLDVVFVIDISGSMADGVSSTDNTARIVATVEALNRSIEKVMGLNEYTRIGVVAFSSTAATVLELGRYGKGTRTPQGGGQQNSVTNYFSTGAGYGSYTLYTHVVPESGNGSQLSASRAVSGGTNIQIGYYAGLQMLANASSTATINGQSVDRVPALIFLSDGAPTYSSSSSSWWAPASNDDDGPGSNPSGDSYFIGNGFKALLTAAYMKEAVNRNYANDVSVYTVGMGISALSDAENNLAYITLAPNDHWNDNNNVATDFRSAWATYITNNGTPRVNVGARDGFGRFYNDFVTITHPTGNYAAYDIDTNADALKNLVTDYYDADSANTVANVFDKIVSEIVINIPEVPTEVKLDQTMESGGYLTYTDPVGRYMELKGSSISLLYKGTSYTASDADGDGVFTFPAGTMVKGSDGREYSINNIVITLSEDADFNQTVTVQIPAILIPLRVNQIHLNANGQIASHTHNGELPCELSYTVGLIPDVIDETTGHIRFVPGNSNGSAWDSARLAEYVQYLKDNFNEEDQTVNFYSNLFTGSEKIENNKTGLEHTVGDATATFEPSHTNAFYYVQDAMLIYADAALTVPATANTLDDNATYYYKEIFYHENDVEIKAVARTGHQLKKVAVEQDDNGRWYRVPGSVRLNKLQLFENQKNPNATNTAEDFYASHYNENVATLEHFVVHLGNNGVLKARVTGNLEISKNVTADEGLTAPDKTFTFKVDLTGVDADDEFSYKVVAADGSTVSRGQMKTGDTVAVKHGQTAIIANLPDGVGYTVTELEANQDGFETSYASASGTIEAGATTKAVVTNRYTATPVMVNGDPSNLDFTVVKDFVGRAWTASDSFTFILESNRPTTPMPQGSTPFPNAANPTHYLKEAVATSGAPIHFGSIEFAAPGTYVYTISERIPTPSLPGVSYSGAMYHVTVTITDNGQGTLSKSVSVQQVRNDEGTADNLVTVQNNTAIFKNIFNAADVEWIPVGNKDYIDHYGTNPLTDGMFSFKMAPAANSPANTPMPASAGANGYTIDWNIGPEIGFDAIHFTSAHVAAGATRQNPTVYYYDFSEIIPQGATEIEEDVWLLDGMLYDGKTRTVQVNVYYVTEGSEARIVVEPIYNTTVGNASYNRLVFFNEYTPDPVKATLRGEKDLDGRDWTASDSFAFVLSTSDAATRTAIANDLITGLNKSDMASLANATATQNAPTFAFGELTFSATGTYKFQIAEKQGSIGGVDYDAHVTDVTVTVEADAANKGSMKVTVTYDNKSVSADDEKAVFVNTYDADDSDPVTVTATKTLTGRDMHDSEFFINVEAITQNAPLGNSRPGNAVPAAQNGVASAAIKVLDNVVFTQAGVFEYKIFEHIPSDGQKLGGIRYDESTIYKVVVTVTDNGEGKLVTDTKIYKSEDKGSTFGSTPVNAITFHNGYSTENVTYAPFHLWKVLENKTLHAGDYTFKTEAVINDGGMILPAVTEVKNDANGEIIFSDYTFTKPGVYRVKVYEVIPAEAILGSDGFYHLNGVTYSENVIVEEFTVTDNGYGKLEVSRAIVDGNLIFTNVYRPADSEVVISGTKQYDGGQTLQDGVFSVGLYDATGNELATAPIKADGTFAFAPIAVTFEDIGTHVYTVKEIIPAGATDNRNGTKTYGNVIYDASEYKVEVTVSDVDTDGSLEVTKKITLNANEAQLKFTNIYHVPQNPNIPQTGDSSNLPLWFGLMFVSFGGMIGVSVYNKKRKVQGK